MKLTTILLAAAVAGYSQILNAGGPCRDRTANRVINNLGPYAAAAMCPEWEHARQEYNVRRDVPYIPVPKAEYRIRLRSPERR